ncbi:hypothetical protein C1646_770435 [Rhizophagus diaphanus]|nr:hypothetical protein C1646_770435 [Rhizophagus diaphanus] [Rhizophagus sp. MUCL 43196]
MTNERKVCIDHSVKLTLYHNDSTSGNAQNATEVAGKIIHAKKLFNRWNKQKTKKCFSLRQGMTFNTHYQANSYNNIKRFNRNYKRVYNNAGIDFTSASRDELILASRHKTFLMTQSDWILKPLMHLKYTKKFTYPLQEDYDFSIPYLKTSNIPVSTNEQISDKTPALTFTKPIDLSKVPIDLIPYIPDHHPIYKGDIHNQLTDKQKRHLKPLQVGSKAWKDHIRQLKSKKESEL